MSDAPSPTPGSDGGITVCRFDDLAPNSATRIVVGGKPVAVIRIGDDVYAIGDTCSHADVSLSEGELFCDEKEIECWKHGSTFSIVTGEPQTLPATQPVPVYAAHVVDGDVVLTLDQPKPPTIAGNDAGARA
jgi:3-phenylpropionate/trans-cinnamate dioxygenase ferredoxin subunit